MRNMLINTKLIKEAYGVGDSGIESINIYESIQSMFSLLNDKISYWQFKLVSDEVDTFRLKIIDSANTWIDFGKDKGLETFNSQFVGNKIIGKPGIFFFPVWKHNSIVKSQTLQATIPTHMQLAAMYGSSVDSLKSFSKSSFQEAGGSAAGGLYNDEEDTRNKGLDIALLNPSTENLGTESAMANENLSNVGDSIKEFILNKSMNINTTDGDTLTGVYEKLRAEAGGGSEVLYNDSTPPPFFDKLTREQKLNLFQEIDKENPFSLRDVVELNAEYAQLFNSKYDQNGDMRKQYVGTIYQLISFWSEDNSNDNRPLEMLFDLGLSIDGIGGIQPGNSFNSTYLPKRYQDSAVFQVSNVEHSVDTSTWTTSITSVMRSTIAYVFNDKTVDTKTKEQLDNVKKNIAKKIEKKANPNPSDGGIWEYNEESKKLEKVKTDEEKYYENTTNAFTIKMEGFPPGYEDLDMSEDTPESRAAFLQRYNELNNTDYKDVTEIPGLFSTVSGGD